jgi:hypothetical protein
MPNARICRILLDVEQKLMRDADIRTTMNIYGDAATEDIEQAHSKVCGDICRSLLNGSRNGVT